MATCKVYEIGCWLSWVVDEVEQLCINAYAACASGLASIIESFPAPDFLSSPTTLHLSSSVSWALSPFDFQFGLNVIVSALIARFILRRIPLIGG